MASRDDNRRVDPKPPLRFVAGGVLGVGESYYVEREADTRLVAELLRGRLCYVLGPRQIGKSSLRMRAMSALRQPPKIQVAHVNFQSIGCEPEADWYRSLIRRTAAELGLTACVPEFLARHAHSGPVNQWTSFFKEEVLLKLGSQVVIFFDEIDMVLKPEFRFSADSFFASIRALYEEARGSFGQKPRLTFCLIGVANPEDLIRDALRSPFNLDHAAIELEDFTVPGAAALQPGLASLPGDAKQWLTEIMGWTDGHPYMTQKVCQRLTDQFLKVQGAAKDSAAIAKSVQEVVSDLFLAGSKDPNLSYAEAQFEHIRDHHDRHDVVVLYRRIYLSGTKAYTAHQVEYAPQDRLQSLLLLSGMVKVLSKGGKKRLTVRNRIFREVFGPKWIQERDQTPDWLTNKLFSYCEKGGDPSFALSRPDEERVLHEIPESGQNIPADLAEFMAISRKIRFKSERRTRVIVVSSFMVFIALSFTVVVLSGYLWVAKARVKSETEKRVAIEREVDWLRRYHDYAEKEIKTLNEKIRQLEHEAKDLLQSLEEVRAKLTAKENQLRRLKRKGKVVLREWAQLKQQRESIEQELGRKEDLRETLAGSRQQQEAARRSYDKRLKELNAKVGTPASLSGEELALRALLEGIHKRADAVSQEDSLKLRQAVMAVSEGGLRLPFRRVIEPGLSALKLCPAATGVRGSRLFLTAANSGLTLWDGEGNSLSTEFVLPAGAKVRSMAVKSKCSQVLVATDKQVIAFGADGQRFGELSTTEPVRAMAGLDSPDDDLPEKGYPVVLGMGQSATLQYLRQKVFSAGAKLPHSEQVTAVDLSQNGQNVLSAAGRRVQWWHAVSGERLRLLREHPAKVRTVALSHATKDASAVSAADDGSVVVFGTKTGATLYSLVGHEGAVHSAAFSQDGHYIVTASADRSVRIWSYRDGSLVFALTGLPKVPLSAELGADGKQLVVMLSEGEARIYQVGDHDFIQAGCAKLRPLTTVAGCQ